MSWDEAVRAAPALVLAAAVATGCGGAGNRHRRSVPPLASNVAPAGEARARVAPMTTPAGPYLNDDDHDMAGDGDGDNSRDDDHDPDLDYKPEEKSSRYHDADDTGLLTSGQATSAAQERDVTAVVERYYALAASENGAGACARLTPSLAGAVPTDYGRYGPSYLHGGKTCAAVLTLLFRHYHRQLSAPMAVTGVRILGGQAYALLGSKAMPADFIVVQSEGGAWRLTQLLGDENSLP